MDDLLKIYEDDRKKIIDKIRKFSSESVDAGVGSEGDYTNQLNSLERKLEDIDKRIQERKESKSPNEWNIVVYVLTDYKQNILTNLCTEHQKLLPPLRHSETELRHWQPFQTTSPKDIEQYLNEFKQNEGFHFDVIYFCDNSDDIETKLDNHITDKVAIAIIDLLSISEKNEPLAKRFDTKNMKSTLLPICLELSKELRDFMGQKEKKIFTVSNKRLKDECCCYFARPREEDVFLQDIRKLFPANGKIKNTIHNPSIDSSVRTLNPKFQ